MLFSPFNFWQFPPAFSDELLDYSIDASAMLADDVIVSASVSISPSGDGELTASLIHVVDSVITAWLGGGVGNRTYTIKYLFTTEAGRVFDLRGKLSIYPMLLVNGPPAPPSEDFGTPITWNNSGDVITEHGAVLATETGAELMIG